MLSSPRRGLTSWSGTTTSRCSGSPTRSTLPLTWAASTGVIRRYNDEAFARFWRREFDPEDVAAVEALLIEVGAPAGFPDFLVGEGGAAHDRLRNEAEASGVFGVPTFVFDDELFWGGDRIGLLRERLDERGVRAARIHRTAPLQW